MSNKKTILITGAGSGMAEGAAIGMARAGHHVIAGVQIAPQVTALRRKAAELGLEKNLRVEKLDILNPFDVSNALKFDIDILFSHAGIGEAGPLSEVPIELVRSNFETNLFAPLALVQKFVNKWVGQKKKGKIVFTSSLLGLITVPGFGPYEATKHALEAIAEELQTELKPFGIKVQVINPGPFFTGFNETMAETPFRWLDDHTSIIKRSDLRATFDQLLAAPDGKLDPRIIIDALVRIVPEDSGKFRNIIPETLEASVKQSQAAAFSNTI
ncbi:SDR family oxidoreductase [Mucilaginibacter sp. BJC16-A38]|uniref:SDR family oxidoreductase n=1 Tax=Mucilaginibacter phenanthrenivorans TaxID=1234842 RepID=UPI002157E103|nr:SDR family oxidoreductase [Mucilaginibacter phenanthrenivorans]MCR8557346.1 SDR family oxidoreductase [Mucilaginibacter phenanthrenivorans]